MKHLKWLFAATSLKAMGCLLCLGLFATSLFGFPQPIQDRLDRRAMSQYFDLPSGLQLIEYDRYPAVVGFGQRDSVKPKVLDLNRLVDDMGWLLHCLVDDDIEVQTRLDAEPATVRVDVSQMEQVIMNLVTNARDAMAHGGVLTVETSNVLPGEPDDGNDTGPGASHVTLAVRDSGTGMDAEVKARLFEPFFTTNVRGKGTGLGLSTVLSIVEQNQGRIEVESEPGRGSAFLIHLPWASKDAASESVASSSPNDTETQITAQYPVGVALAQD